MATYTYDIEINTRVNPDTRGTLQRLETQIKNLEKQLSSKGISRSTKRFNDLKNGADRTAKAFRRLTNNTKIVDRTLRDNTRTLGFLGRTFDRMRGSASRFYQALVRLTHPLQNLRLRMFGLNAEARSFQIAMARTQTAVISLSQVLAFVLLYNLRRLGIAIVQTIDILTRFNNRLIASRAPLADQITAASELRRVAEELGVDIESLSQSFQRYHVATRAIGLSNRKVLEQIETLTKGFIVFGLSAQEANAATLQLFQGAASGVLQGDELRTIRETFPDLARAIAEAAGGTIGDLKELGRQGKLTAGVISEALGKMKTVVDALYGSTQRTFVEQFGRIKNIISFFLKDILDASSVLISMRRTIDKLAKYLKRLSVEFRTNQDALDRLKLLMFEFIAAIELLTKVLKNFYAISKGIAVVVGLIAAAFIIFGGVGLKVVGILGLIGAGLGALASYWIKNRAAELKANDAMERTRKNQELALKTGYPDHLKEIANSLRDLEYAFGAVGLLELPVTNAVEFERVMKEISEIDLSETPALQFRILQRVTKQLEEQAALVRKAVGDGAELTYQQRSILALYQKITNEIRKRERIERRILEFNNKQSSLLERSRRALQDYLLERQPGPPELTRVRLQQDQRPQLNFEDTNVLSQQLADDLDRSQRLARVGLREYDRLASGQIRGSRAREAAIRRVIVALRVELGIISSLKTALADVQLPKDFIDQVNTVEAVFRRLLRQVSDPIKNIINPASYRQARDDIKALGATQQELTDDQIRQTERFGTSDTAETVGLDRELRISNEIIDIASRRAAEIRQEQIIRGQIDQHLETERQKLLQIAFAQQRYVDRIQEELNLRRQADAVTQQQRESAFSFEQATGGRFLEPSAIPETESIPVLQQVVREQRAIEQSIDAIQRKRSDPSYLAPDKQNAIDIRKGAEAQIQLYRNTLATKNATQQLSAQISKGLGSVFVALTNNFDQFLSDTITGFADLSAAAINYAQELEKIELRRQKEQLSDATVEGLQAGAASGLTSAGIGVGVSLATSLIQSYFQRQEEAERERRRREEELRRHRFALLEAAANQRDEIILLERQQLATLAEMNQQLEETKQLLAVERAQRQSAQEALFRQREQARFQSGFGSTPLPSTLTAGAARGTTGATTASASPNVTVNLAQFNDPARYDDYLRSTPGAIAVADGLANNTEISQPVLGVA